MAAEMPPRATLRLQLHRGFTLEHAAAQIDYFAALGVSHLYLSPILTARAGSMHGYDVVDHSQINPELGGEDALRRLSAKLRERGMGIIVDIVPNHMAILGADNPWWLDVLEHGRGSKYAGYFDIDWNVPDPALRGRIAVPLLGKPYGEALAAGEIKLERDGDKWYAQYFEHRLPLAPRTIDGSIAEIGAEPARLHRLLERQHWRLAWWRTAGDEINFRRFFDIVSLAALRVEEPAVFEDVHATIFRLYAEGIIDGVRVDHVDGLADPRGYCRRLRGRLSKLAAQRPHDAPTPAYLIVEKILGSRERLPRDWRVDGTSGYSFMNHVGALLHDPAGEEPLTALWTGLTGRAGEFEVEQRQARRRILDELLTADFNATVLALHRIARSDPKTRDITLAAIRRVLTELLVQMPVYRVYADRQGRAADDETLMSDVRDAARKACRPAEREFVDLIDRWLGAEPPASVRPIAAQKLRMRAIARFQQLSAPLAAKSVEDTAFYRHGRLLSRNEVGADPAQFALAVEGFHEESARRREYFPDTLLATATHDHKRGEDVRARLAVLSERSQAWIDAVHGWRALNAPLRQHLGDHEAPAPADEYMLYQMLAGAWPLELRPDDADALRAYAERLAGWQQKAVREAKLRSSWIEPNAPYEDACKGFLDALLDPARSPEFLPQLHRFVESIAPAAALNGLSQALLRMTTPGLPDLYQGTELWDFSLVDPDNRRPVDFQRRRELLARIDRDDRSGSGIERLLQHWRDGAIKQQLIARTLALRRRLPQLFARGRYEPVEVRGTHADRAIAFVRRDARNAVLVIAPRLCAELVDAARPRVPSQHWLDTHVVTEGSSRQPVQGAWRNALEGERPDVRQGAWRDVPAGDVANEDLRLAHLLARWPVGLWIAHR